MTKRLFRRIWMFEMGHCVADGDPEPDVPWPSDWEVCGIPSFDPFLTSNKPKRRGTTCLAWPMYHVADPFLSLAAACLFLEQMTPAALEAWLSLPDRFLSMSCSNTEMDLAQMNTTGFSIPPELIVRIRRLGLRLRVSFHPHTKVRWDGSY
jgi:hypothetical protein